MPKTEPLYKDEGVIQRTYSILKTFAEGQERLPYSVLTDAYRARYPEEVGPQGPRGWDHILREISERCAGAKLPRLQSLVFNTKSRVPGRSYAHSDTGGKPYSETVDTVFAHKQWPKTLP